MFGFGKRKQAGATRAEGTRGDPVISAVLMQGTTFPFDALQQRLSNFAIVGTKPSGLQLEKDGILTFNVGDELFALALMPAPYPWSDLEGPCHTSWMWPPGTSATSVKAHKTHLLVTAVGGKSDPIARRVALTQVTAHAAQLPGVMGVYWPDATMVHFPKIFIEMSKAASVEAPPMYLWVDFRIFRNADGTSGLFTTGLAPMGQMEIEIPRIDMPPGELREWAINIAYYFLEQGDKVKDGHTIGMTAEQQIRIRHRPSQFDRPGKVIRLEA